MKKSKENYVWLGQIPIGIGALLKGWDILEKDFRDPNRLSVVDFRAMTEKCPRDCDFCFTDKNKKTLSLREIKRAITEISQMGARGINFLGEGEPTLDKDFFEIIEFTSSLGVIPIVFTEAASKLRDRSFVKRLKIAGASIFPKCDSIFNSTYQNEIVKDKSGEYFYHRNEAIALLVDEGFNEIKSDGTTRLGFDMVLTDRNINEVVPTLERCRQLNIFVIFTLYLPSGRVIKNGLLNDNSYLHIYQINQIKSKISAFDQWCGFNHIIHNNFFTTGCVERLQIFGDGRVSPCPGNETIIGKIQDYSIKELNRMILSRFPGHNPCSFNGNCPYR